MLFFFLFIFINYIIYSVENFMKILIMIYF